MRIEGGPKADGDRHALLVDRDSCRLYELFALRKRGGKWRAGSGAIWNLRSNKLRPAGWTSADAAGLPILPGLARFNEVKKGVINHALRVTVENTRRAYIYPARHHASDLTGRNLPPMGLRLRLRADFPIASYPKQARVILTALKRYGMIVADNGSDWFVSGAPSSGWDNDQLHSLARRPRLRLRRRGHVQAAERLARPRRRLVRRAPRRGTRPRGARSACRRSRGR